MQTMTYPRIDRPTQKGMYWFRGRRRWVCFEVDFRRTGEGLAWAAGDETGWYLHELEGEWRGPIPKPGGDQLRPARCLDARCNPF